MSRYCPIHGGAFSADHGSDECPILGDVQEAISYALGWRDRLVPTPRLAEAVRLAFDAALAEDTAEHRKRARMEAESKVARKYEDEAYKGSQAERRAKQEVAAVKSDARRKIEAEHNNMRDVLTGFVQSLVDHHLPHEAVQDAAERVATEGYNNYIGRDAFALDMADRMVGDPVDVDQR